MATKKKSDDSVTERPYKDAKADPKHITEVENRQPDQIADYHKKNPTLKVTDSHKEDPPTLFDQTTE